MKCALLIIDVQKAFIGHQQGTLFYENVIAHINATSLLFRQSDLPVFVIRDLEEGDGDEYQNVTELDVHNTDITINKYFNNSFWQTTLEQDLKDKGIDTVILCGNALEFCVTATYFGALERGFKAMLLQQGLFAVEPKSLDQLYTTRPLLSYTALQAFVKKEKR